MERAIVGPPDAASQRPDAAPDAETVRRVRRWLQVLAVLGSGSLVGVALSPYLVTHWPLTLVLLSPLGRHLVLVAPVVDPAAFLAVAVGRRLLFYFACFRLGRALGPWALPWLEARAAWLARFVRLVERIFARAPRLVVAVMAGPTVCALAGIAAMRTRTFLILATGSLVVRMALVLGFAAWVETYLTIVLGWIEDHWVPATVATAGGVVATRWLRRRRSLRAA